jgi:hypothetical protein
VEADERRWAERVAEAARAAAEDLRMLGDPMHTDLIQHLDELTARLTAELEAHAGSGPPPRGLGTTFGPSATGSRP